MKLIVNMVMGRYCECAIKTLFFIFFPYLWNVIKIFLNKSFETNAV